MVLFSLCADLTFDVIAVHKAQPGWRRVIAQAVLWGIPTPAFSTALAFFDGYRSEILPANILQAQRDYFGAHTFRVLPGKENARLKAGEDIRKYPSPSERGPLFSPTTLQTSTGPGAVAMFPPPVTMRDCCMHSRETARALHRQIGLDLCFSNAIVSPESVTAEEKKRVDPLYHEHCNV